jgi:restriction system protein
VDTIDPGSGHPIRPCLITLRTTREVFNQLDLARVEPLACLKHLSASVSKSPAELIPVRPVLEFSMVDPRFIAESDALSLLDERPNLLELTPGEFEVLVQNLFTCMGLEAKQTRASRDGGVDCVACDSRPILGGKVVIQAKRYKNTVGVSAVRDLFGTLQNEGASKGILVTTSGYGPASFEFAKNKPIELIDGAQLLYLLKAHADIDARIQAPDDWHDPLPDSAF